MNSKTVSRRSFLKTSGLVLGSAVLVGTGLSALDSSHELIALPEYKYGENIMSKKILITYASVAGSTAVSG